MQASSPSEPDRPATSASTAERVTAAIVAVLVVALGGVAWRFGAQFIGENDGVFPAINCASIVALLVSAAIARNQFRATGFPTLAFVSNLFGVSAVSLAAYVAVMPRVFSPNGFGFGDESAIWLWTAGRFFFLVLVAGYVVAEAIYARRAVSSEDAHAIGGRYAMWMVTSAAAIIGAILVLHAKLPSLGDANGFTPLFHRFVEPALLGLGGTLIVALAVVTRMRQTANLWLGVALLTYTIETYVAAETIHGQYTIAWYLIFAGGACVQTIYLLTQLRNENKHRTALAVDKKILIQETLRDPLTSLLNRAGFEERFDDIMTESRLAGKPASIVIFDIDHFQSLNDAYGIQAGDDALRKISEAIALVANRPTDACCRIGGEEFAIVLGETDPSGAMTVAEKVRSTIMRLRIRQDPSISDHLTASVGTASAPANVIVSSAELFARGEKALAKAKRLGRNRIATYDVARDAELTTA